jgi:hypothetical protein
MTFCVIAHSIQHGSGLCATRAIGVSRGGEVGGAVEPFKLGGARCSFGVSTRASFGL